MSRCPMDDVDDMHCLVLQEVSDNLEGWKHLKGKMYDFFCSPDALEKEAEAGGKFDTYEVEGPDRAELLQDLAEFQLAAVRASHMLGCSITWHCMVLCQG